MEDKVVVSNIPSSNRGDFGYRSINTSEAHNEHHNNMVDDILDLYNKTNEMERIIRENADFIKLENTHLESVNYALASKYNSLISGYNELLNGEMSRKRIILPHECEIDDARSGAIINKTTSDITVRPSRKMSKLAIFDSVTDGMYLPDSLEVDIRCQTIGVISETDNDIYAPFYNDNQMYWTRRVVTDNTVEEVTTEYIINLAEEIMITSEMNEVTIHPFMCGVSDIYVRYGDSNPWEKIANSEHHPALNGIDSTEDFAGAPRPFTISFPNTKANQMKVILKSNGYVEGETNLRNFMFGLKHIGAYVNFYNNYESSNFYTELEIDETDTVMVEGLTFNFNNEPLQSKFLSDIDYEFYYKDEYGSYQKIFEEFPFIPPSNKLMIRFRIGERYKEINIRSIELNYRVIKDVDPLMVSYMEDMTVDFKYPFKVIYAVKESESDAVAKVVRHEITIDSGVTWKQISPLYDGLVFSYEHPAFHEECVNENCQIRVYDFDGNMGISNKFKITSKSFDKSPTIDPISDIEVFIGDNVRVEYRAGDDYDITRHEFSDDNGASWMKIDPIVQEDSVRGITYYKYYVDLDYDSVSERNCFVRVSDGVNEPTMSNMFKISIKPILVESIVIDNYDTVIKRGETEKINHTVLPLNASDKTVHWTSSEPSIATVDSFGLVTAINKGKCKIKVESNDKKKNAICEVEVIIPVEDVKLNVNDLVLFVGEEFKLVETIYPIDADIKRVTWTKTNDCVNVEDGLVTAMKAGACVVTVTTEDGSFTDQCVIEVRVPVQDLEINKNSSVVYIGETEQLSAKIIPENAYNKKVLWSSTKEDILTVNSNGLMQGISKGTAVITAASDEKPEALKTCIVDVIKNVSSVDIDEEVLEIQEGNNKSLLATVLPDDAFDKRLIWTTSNPYIARVDSNGVVTGIKIGECAITATSVSSGITDSCIVKVKNRLSGISVLPETVYAIDNVVSPKVIKLEILGHSISTDKEEIIFDVISGDPEGLSFINNDPNIEGFSTEFKTSYIDVKGNIPGEYEVVARTFDNKFNYIFKVVVSSAISDVIWENEKLIEGEEQVTSINIPSGLTRRLNYKVLPEDCKLNLSSSRNGGKGIKVHYGSGSIDVTDGVNEDQENCHYIDVKATGDRFGNRPTLSFEGYHIYDKQIRFSTQSAKYSLRLLDKWVPPVEIKQGDTIEVPMRMSMEDKLISPQDIFLTKESLSVNGDNGKIKLEITEVESNYDESSSSPQEYDVVIRIKVAPWEFSEANENLQVNITAHDSYNEYQKFNTVFNL